MLLQKCRREEYLTLSIPLAIDEAKAQKKQTLEPIIELKKLIKSS